MKKKVIKFWKRLQIIEIDVFIYRITENDLTAFPDIGYTIQTETISKNKIKYFIVDKGISIHNCFLFNKIYLLRLIKKKGPVLGDGYTRPEYRGKSILPFVICYIVNEIVFDKNTKEVFIIINKSNLSSIAGVEKTGFKRYASINAKRWLWFYFDKNIVNY